LPPPPAVIHHPVPDCDGSPGLIAPSARLNKTAPPAPTYPSGQGPPTQVPLCPCAPVQPNLAAFYFARPMPRSNRAGAFGSRGCLGGPVLKGLMKEYDRPANGTQVVRKKMTASAAGLGMALSSIACFAGVKLYQQQGRTSDEGINGLEIHNARKEHDGAGTADVRPATAGLDRQAGQSAVG